MALLIVKSVETKPVEVRSKSSFSFREWYKQHKEELSKKKKERYNTDSAYRAAIIARSAKVREDKKKQKVGSDVISI